MPSLRQIRNTGYFPQILYRDAIYRVQFPSTTLLVAVPKPCAPTLICMWRWEEQKKGVHAGTPLQNEKVERSIGTKEAEFYCGVEVAVPVTKRMTSKAKGKLGLEALTASEN